MTRYLAGVATGIALAVATIAATIWRTLTLHEQPAFGTPDMPDGGTWG